MPDQTVGATLPPDTLPIVARTLGLDPFTTPHIGLVKAALALFHGRSRDEACSLVLSRRARPDQDGTVKVVGRIPSELADVGETERAYAIRVGMGIAMGMTRRQAETWASTLHRGRPPGASNKPKPESPDRTRLIRAWANSRGIPVNERGRIPQRIADEYDREERVRQWAITVHGMPAHYHGPIPQTVMDAYQHEHSGTRADQQTPGVADSSTEEDSNAA